MRLTRRALRTFVTVVLALAPMATPARAAPLRAPNVVEISPQLVTSGQPSAAALADLGEQGFGAVIYLVPPTVHDAVKDEGVIVARQGFVFVNIPIAFDHPTDSDFEAFAGALRGLAGREVLVHCQVNMRASTMVFLYRTIVAKEDPQVAYESVIEVRVPEGLWKRFVRDPLRKHKVDFEPY